MRMYIVCEQNNFDANGLHTFLLEKNTTVQFNKDIHLLEKKPGRGECCFDGGGSPISPEGRKRR